MIKKKLKIGIIGCGTIGSEIGRAIDRGFKKEARIEAISDIDKEKARALREKLKSTPEIVDINSLIRKSDIVVEAASAKVSGGIARKAILAKKDVLIMSVGGIIKNYTALFNLAEKNKCKVYLPSGAVCGIDGVKAASVGKIYRAELTTRKPPAGLRGAPFIRKNNINLDDVKSETTIFYGNAIEAIEGFPANINVSCVLSIAGIGPKDTMVRIIASPEYKSNSHEILLEGEFGRLSAKTENVPSPNNPKTSYLAVLSAIAVLRQVLGPAKVGT